MGLYAFEVRIIAGVCANLKKPFEALSLGHPDILATQKELGFLKQKIPIDNQGVLESRNFAPKPSIIGNARPVFEAMGGSLHVIDYSNVYGVDEIINLNTENIPGTYDLVIDPGTTEHCFNVGNALVGAASAVKMGGYIYHMVPLCHWNHGFWNFSPCVFADFYEQNGFEIVRLEAEYRGRFSPVKPRQKFEITNHGRKLNLMCVAKRVTDQPIAFATQYKYAQQ